MGPAVGKNFQFRKQALQHAFNVPPDLAVREADRGVTTVSVQAIADRVFFGVMRVAIDLDDERPLRAEEIDDTIADDVLAAELVAAEL